MIVQIFKNSALVAMAKGNTACKGTSTTGALHEGFCCFSVNANDDARTSYKGFAACGGGIVLESKFEPDCGPP